MLPPSIALACSCLFAATAFAQSPTVVTTILAAEPTHEPSYVSDSSFQNAILNSTNTWRQDYNASAVQWNDSLAEFASNYIGNCDFSHSGGPYGENLAEGYQNVTATIDAWGNEVKQYDFSKGDFSEQTGHFTQLVWKATDTVGCSRKFCNGQNNVPGWYVVCEYFPRGNILGTFTTNVDPCSNSTACSSAASSLFPVAWMSGVYDSSTWGIWWVFGTAIIVAL